MLALDRQAARATWTVFVMALLITALYLAREAVLLMVLALFLAYMLSPLVAFIEKRLPARVPRGISLALVYLVLTAGIITAGFILGSRLASEGTHLLGTLPGILKNHESLATRPFPWWLEPYREKIVESLRTYAQMGAEQVLPLLKNAGLKVAGLLGTVGFAVLVPILSFFFLKDAARIREDILSWVSNDHQRALLNDITEDLHFLLGKYIRALVILSAATFIFYLIFLQLIGAPYSALLAAIAAPLEFIPVVGPLTASLTIIVVALLSGYPQVLWIIIFLLVYRLFQDYVLQPYLMSEGVELHPLMVIFGAIAGEQIAGVWGMFLSVPVIATLRVVIVRIRKLRTYQPS
ncbi:MAG TPA: AI-2E family transporter [Bryobacteraceae bacterium]|nr:AI-2E family transporter [Bryobacteraceae bacterium]